MNADEKTQLAGIPTLVAFAAALVGLIAIVFPSGEQYASLTNVRGPDRYSIAYLEVLTRANPKEVELRLLYVRQLAQLGQFEEALRQLEPVLKAKEHDAEVKNLLFDILLARGRALASNDPKRRDIFARISSLLDDLLLVHQNVPRLCELAQVALALERPKLAAEYWILAAQNGDAQEQAKRFAEAARWLRASGEELRSAQYYRKASEVESDPKRRRDWAGLAIDSLESENKIEEASDLAIVYANQFSDDVDIVSRAARLATACSRHEEARDWGRRLIAISPESDAILEAQVSRELAAKDLQMALHWAHRLVQRNPNSVAFRESEAHIAEWAGKFDWALQDWLWLVKRGGISKLGKGRPPVGVKP